MTVLTALNKFRATNNREKMVLSLYKYKLLSELIKESVIHTLGMHRRIHASKRLENSLVDHTCQKIALTSETFAQIFLYLTPK